MFKVAFITLLFIALALFALTSQSQACVFNTDCEVGSKCIKASGAIYGICAGGLLPGNKYDQKPVYAPLDLNETYGNTCSFDIDCGPGSVCVKESGHINGVCMKRY